MGNEPVIAGIEHRGMQEPIDKQRARFFVELVFHRHAAERDFNDGVDILRRALAGWNELQVHCARPSWRSLQSARSQVGLFHLRPNNRSMSASLSST